MFIPWTLSVYITHADYLGIVCLCRNALLNIEYRQADSSNIVLTYLSVLAYTAATFRPGPNSLSVYQQQLMDQSFLVLPAYGPYSHLI